MALILFSVILLLLLTTFSLAKSNSILNNPFNINFLLILLIAAVSTNIVGREINYDTVNYLNWFYGMQNLDWQTARIIYETDILFFTITWVISRFTDSYLLFLASLWILFLIPFWFALKKMFNYWQLSIVLMTFLLFVFFYSYTTNVLRQGLAMAFILLAAQEILNNKVHKINIKIILYSFLAYLFHWTAVPFAIVLLILSKKELKLRTTLIVWSFSALSYMLNLNELILSPLSNYFPKIESYSAIANFNKYGASKNRLDFLLFSLFWVFISLFLYNYIYKNILYKKIINVFVLFNAIFLLLGFIAYSDRIAGYSWILIPILVWFPILNSERYRTPLTVVGFVFILIISIVTGTFENIIPFQKFANL